MTPATAMSTGAAPVRTARLPMSGVLGGSAAITLGRPLAWLLGLAGFLAGGGVLLMTAPIVVLPTPTGLQNALGGPVSTLVVGTPSPAMLLLLGGAAVATVLLLAGGLLVAAWAERHLVALQLDAARDEGLLEPPSLDGAPGTAAVAVVRLLALLPVVAVVIVAWQPLYDATYRELVLPDDLATPLGIRVIRELPWLVAAVAVAWLAGDSAAALGVRRLLVGRRPVPVAWLQGWIDLVRRPVRVALTAAFGVVLLVLLAGPGILAAAAGWARVREVMTHPDDATAVLVTVVAWVAVWLGGLLLAGVGAAARAAAWTLESTPTAPPARSGEPGRPC